jgi:hypothetical protein
MFPLGYYKVIPLHYYKGLGFTPWTMEDGLFPWSDFLKNQFTKFVGFLLGVNQLWTERTDHALKSKCVGIFSGLCSHSGTIKSYYYIIIRVGLHRGRWKMVFFVV